MQPNITTRSFHSVNFLLIALIFFSLKTFAQPNRWSIVPQSGITPRFYAVGFSIGNKGYIGTGYDGNFTKDFWEYDPFINSWTQKADFGGTGRLFALGFSIQNKGYIGTGLDERGRTNDFWEYDPSANI